jgi:hypothetical protein
MDPERAGKWAADEKRAHEWPVCYVNRDNKEATVNACIGNGLKPADDFGLWVATLDGEFTDNNGADLRHEPGVVVVQAFGTDRTGIDADASVITALGDTWLGLPPSWEAVALRQARQLAELLADHA